MRYEQEDIGTDDVSELINTDQVDLDGQNICVRFIDGYGGCDIEIGSHIITWKQLDKLKKAIDIAEKCWRNRK